MKNELALYMVLATITGLVCTALMASVTYPPWLFGAGAGAWAAYKLAKYIDKDETK